MKGPCRSQGVHQERQWSRQIFNRGPVLQTQSQQSRAGVRAGWGDRMALALLCRQTRPRILAPAGAGVTSESKEGPGASLEGWGHREWGKSRIVASINRSKNKICFPKELRNASPAKACLRILHSLVSLPTFFPRKSPSQIPTFINPALLPSHPTHSHLYPFQAVSFIALNHYLIYFTHSCLFIAIDYLPPGMKAP